MLAWNNELAWKLVIMNQNIVRNKNFIEKIGRSMSCLMGWWAQFIDQKADFYEHYRLIQLLNSSLYRLVNKQLIVIQIVFLFWS